MKLIQEQLRQLESRNEELETKFADVTRANLELQVAERELRDQIVTCVSREEIQKMEKKMEVEKRRWDSNTVQGKALGCSPRLCGFCSHYFLGQLRTDLGPLAQWSRLCLS